MLMRMSCEAVTMTHLKHVCIAWRPSSGRKKKKSLTIVPADTFQEYISVVQSVVALRTLWSRIQSGVKRWHYQCCCSHLHL